MRLIRDGILKVFINLSLKARTMELKRRQQDNAEAGFSTWEATTARKYNKLVEGIRR